ncbi:chromosome segregation ATPase [Xanthomonas sacchari]|uniref:DNA-binding protein n=1 Tax=Xanthomonas sacchari TaxID=56458 RepID=UPI00278BA470|nr:DNA-binding protein [Xanthomonas sacchari]MDQ1090657.1 chromosome segregation ATPase [Xanthomonas sacchari]
MGRSPTVSFDEVDDTIRRLLAQGQQPTAQRLRAGLGERGSPVLLQRLTADWYSQYGPAYAGRLEQLAAAIAKAASAPKPAVDVQAHLKAVTEQALQQVDQAHQQRMAELESRIAELDAGEQSLRQRETSLEVRAVALRELVDHCRQEAATAHANYEAAQQASATLHAELAAAKAAQAEYAARLDAAGVERTQLKDEADRLGQALAALEERFRAAEQQCQQLEERLARETIRADALLGMERQLRELHAAFAAGSLRP